VSGTWTLGREVLRLLLRRPVLGIVAVALDEADRLVLMRRRDTGTWCLPGGMCEWGEDLRAALGRELREEVGCELVEVRRVVGIYSDPARDPRMHAVAVVVEARVRPARGAEPPNPLEVLEVRSFLPSELPAELAHDTRRLVDDYLAGAPAVLA
jgi:ADP-ribose pyrophosphatase YjhB (NUDIX family)